VIEFRFQVVLNLLGKHLESSHQKTLPMAASKKGSRAKLIVEMK